MVVTEFLVSLYIFPGIDVITPLSSKLNRIDASLFIANPDRQLNSSIEIWIVIFLQDRDDQSLVIVEHIQTKRTCTF